MELSYDNTSLTILAFTWSSSGQYTCVAVNSEDTALATVVVRAQGLYKAMGFTCQKMRNSEACVKI